MLHICSTRSLPSAGHSSLPHSYGPGFMGGAKTTTLSLILPHDHRNMHSDNLAEDGSILS